MSLFENQQAEQRNKEEEFRRNEARCLRHIDELVTYLARQKRELDEKGITYRTAKHDNRARFRMWERDGTVDYSTGAESEFLVVVVLPTGHALAVASSSSNGTCRYAVPWWNDDRSPPFAREGEIYGLGSLSNDAAEPQDVLKAVVSMYAVESRAVAEAERQEAEEKRRKAAEVRKEGGTRQHAAKSEWLSHLLALAFGAAGIPIAIAATKGLHHFLQVDCNNSGSCFFPYTNGFLDIFIFIVNILLFMIVTVVGYLCTTAGIVAIGAGVGLFVAVKIKGDTAS